MVAFLIILFVLSAILMLKVCIIIEYHTEVALTVRIYGIPLHLLPAKKRRVKPMSAKQAEKIRIRRAKEEDAKKEKAHKKRLQKAEKKKKAAEKKRREKTDPEARRKAKEAKKKKKAESATFEENLDLVKKLASFFFSRFFRHLRIEASRIHITVGTEEAAKTAILYGITVQAVSYILCLLDKFTNFHGLEKQDVYVDTNFLSEEMEVDIKISFSIRLWHILHIAFGALGRLISNRLKVKRRVTEEQNRKPPESTPPAPHQNNAENPA